MVVAAFAPLAALVLGLILGSFAAALSYRLVRGQDWIAARSSCPDCGMRLSALELIPIVSFLRQSGRCRHCGSAISWRYPIIEGISAIACALVVAVLGLTVDALLVGALAFILITLAAADFDAQILPDPLQICVGVLGLIWSAVHGMLLSSGLACAFGLIIGLGLRFYYQRFRGLEALGLGDVKLLAVAGLWVGIASMSWYLLLSAGLGIGLAAILRKSGTDRIPFGVALTLGLYLVVLTQAGLNPS